MTDNYLNQLNAAGKTYDFYDITNLGDLKHLPFSLKVLLENLLRNYDGEKITKDDLNAVISRTKTKKAAEMLYSPARVLMQDFTGVPAVVDLAAMRDGMVKSGGEASKINPMIPVDLVIDHSVMVDNYGNSTAFSENVKLEYERNKERYAFLKWGQKAFKNFRAVPPGTGICHQVNLENLAQAVWTKEENGRTIAYPDTVVGTDSHTTMINGLAVLGWGVGGIEAEAAMLGQSISMLIPEVIGVHLHGTLPKGSTATDLVLTITNILRTKGVVGKFVEFYGPGLNHLSLADRATIANMAPEYGATCGFFPIDSETINFLKLTGRDDDRIALVEAYAKAQGMWRDADTAPTYNDTVDINLSSVEPTMAGPKRPQDKILVKDMKAKVNEIADSSKGYQVEGKDYKLHNNDVTIAAITSCTNTSNPSVMVAAGLVAKKAHALGITPKPWVKTSLAPGSQVVTGYLEKAGLMQDLDAIGFNLVGYGCTTCIGNSGPLAQELQKVIDDNDMTVSGVLSGNRNFEGRISPHVKANYLASPPLVIIYALAGTTNIDIFNDPITTKSDGTPVMFEDLWPSDEEISDTMKSCITSDIFKSKYADVFAGDAAWQAIQVTEKPTFDWDDNSTYIKHPPYFEMDAGSKRTFSTKDAHILMKLGDSVTTDHISPAGNIKPAGPSGEYLKERNIDISDFNSYGARRGNHEIMMRGTFANIRIQNELTPKKTGGYTRCFDENPQDVISVFDAATAYAKKDRDLVVIGGKEYGTGSSRDWAAKGTRLLGIKAVIVESFERIHRSNLVGMGVMPLEFTNGDTRNSLHINGDEKITLTGLENGIKPGMEVTCVIENTDGVKKEVKLKCRLDTKDEVTYFNYGGILPYVLYNVL